MASSPIGRTCLAYTEENMTHAPMILLLTLDWKPLSHDNVNTSNKHLLFVRNEWHHQVMISYDHLS